MHKYVVPGKLEKYWGEWHSGCVIDSRYDTETKNSNTEPDPDDDDI